MVDSINSINAISNVLGKSPTESSAPNSVSFADLLAGLSENVNANLSNAEVMAQNQIAGASIPMYEVVNSVMAAERSLSTAIAIRDKMIQAYTEISHMQI